MTTETLQAPLPRAAAGRSGAYFWLAVLCLVIAVLGFLPTYWLVMARGAFKAHPLMHLHALIFYAWCVFFVFQAWLVTQGKIANHRDWGMAGISLATLVVVFGILTAIHAGVRASEAGFAGEAKAFLIVPLSGIVLFGAFVAAAISNIRKAENHKALMLAATASMLGAPVARWFLTFLAPAGAAGPPPVEATVLPAILGMAPLFALLFIEWRTRGAPQRVSMTATALAVAIVVLSAPISKTSAWQGVADALIGLG